MPFQFTAGGDSSVTMTEIEVDFGPLPLSEASFDIIDATSTTTSVILSKVSKQAPTGKDQDEIDMDSFQTKAIPYNGHFTLYVSTTDGSYLADKFKVNYIID